MALKPRTAPAAAFEQPKTETAPPAETKTEAAAPAASAPAPTPVATAAPAAAPLVVQVPRSTAVASMQAGHQFMESLKDALRVDWDTLNRLKANQGRIAWDKVSLGEWFEFSLISWQDNWLVSPGSDTDEAKQFAKYSDDGKTIKDTGEDIQVYLQRLKDLGYADARLGKRCVLAMELIDCDKDVDSVEDGMLFQIDLAPTSRASFDRYRAQAALDIGRGRASGDDVVRIRGTAVVKTGGGGSKEYTQLEFTRVKAAA